eukprot:TRINITY_DN8364_c0_g2_i1.p1 TRINITY_DN8364_c0_g2~~TRINITY_DN8364_c0_g2_i1.p1  ORF type:complete len:384 (+),score=71.63 TRINITY_DN8364_c0_g2_i1:44-1153(+)
MAATSHCQMSASSGRSFAPLNPDNKLAASCSLPSLLGNGSRSKSKPASMQGASEKDVAEERKQSIQSVDLACRPSLIVPVPRSPSKKQSCHAGQLSKLVLSNAPSVASSPKPAHKSSHRVDMATQAFMLSRRYRLDLHEVNLVLKELQKVPRALPDGGIEMTDFKNFLQQVLGCQSVPDEMSAHAYRECLAHDGHLDADKFLVWYRNNMFASVASMTADRQMRQKDDLIASVARKYDISLIEAGRIKQKFVQFDMDGSGEIDFPEFCQMLSNLMGLATPGDIPLDRLSRFWNEIDVDGNGTVDFEEFTNWYVKYFRDEQSEGIQEAFYASYSPDVQRSRFVQEAQRAEQNRFALAGNRGWANWPFSAHA